MSSVIQFFCFVLFVAATGAGKSGNAQSGPTVDGKRDPIAMTLYAQDASTYTSDEPYAISWRMLRENDILWKKRVWRTVSLTDAGNVLLTQPALHSPLADILLSGALNGVYKAYSGADDRFVSELASADLQKALAHTAPSDITALRIKEDWIYIAREGRLIRRIIGIAPLVAGSGAAGTLSEVCWLYFPALRPYLALHKLSIPGLSEADNLDKVLDGGHFVGKIDKQVGVPAL